MPGFSAELSVAVVPGARARSRASAGILGRAVGRRAAGRGGSAGWWTVRSGCGGIRGWALERDEQGDGKRGENRGTEGDGGDAGRAETESTAVGGSWCLAVVKDRQSLCRVNRRERACWLGGRRLALGMCGEPVAHVGSGSGSVGWILGQQVSDQRIEVGGCARAYRCHCQGRLMLVLPEHGKRIVAGERWMTGEHGVQHASQRVQVRARVHRSAAGLFGGHVRAGADGHVRGGEVSLLLVGEAGDAEVADFYRAPGGEEDVGRLDVSMHHSLGVCYGERVTGLAGDVDCLVDRQRAAGEQRLDAGPVDEFHHQVRHIVIRAHVVDSDDIWMGEAAGRSGLPVEPLQHGRVRRICPVEQLDCDGASESFVNATPDRRHAPAAQYGLQPVAA